MARKNVEVIATFDMHGKPTPIRARLITESGENFILKVDRIKKTDTDKTAGNLMFRYHCEVFNEGVCTPFELRYEIATCRWFLY